MQDARGDPRASDRLSVTSADRPPGKVGRFAPTPSGPLHAGSLVAALASSASIRSAGGLFSVRIDDLDTARAVPGAHAAILATLRAFGLFEPGTPLLLQSERLGAYRQALRELSAAGLVFRCSCSRRQLAGRAVYPGTCRARRVSLDELEQRLAEPDRVAQAALRVRLQGELRFTDAVQGERRSVLERDVGDTVVLRRDGIIAWPLATACDDAGAASEVVRGADLLAPTPAQIALMQCLGHAPPRYAHVPVLEDAARRKLGKSTCAQALQHDRAMPLLQSAWAFLGQMPIDADDPASFNACTPALWSIARVPRVLARHHPALAG